MYASADDQNSRRSSAVASSSFVDHGADSVLSGKPLNGPSNNVYDEPSTNHTPLKVWGSKRDAQFLVLFLISLENGLVVLLGAGRSNVLATRFYRVRALRTNRGQEVFENRSKGRRRGKRTGIWVRNNLL